MSHSKQSFANLVKSLIPTVSPVWTRLESIEQMHSWSCISHYFVYHISKNLSKSASSSKVCDDCRKWVSHKVLNVH
jgi:hypothetical protein